MADLTIADVRRRFPQYSDLSDNDLADRLHRRFYSDMPRADFNKRIGLAESPPAAPAAIPAPEVTLEPSYRQQIEAEAANRQNSRIPGEAVDLTQATIGDAVTLGGYPQIMAAGRAGLRALGRVFTRGDGNYLDDYGRERDILRRQIELRRREAGVARTLPLDVLGAATVAPGRAITAAAIEAPSMLSRMGTSAGWGAGLGAVTGFNRETGSWGDKGAGAVEGGVGGAVIGAALPPALATAGRALAPLAPLFRGRRNNRVAAQQEVADDFRNVLGREPPPAVVAESPTLQNQALRTARSVAGGPLRDSVNPAIEATEQGIRRTIAPNPLPAVDEFAGNQQGLLRRNLTEYSRPHAEVEAADRGALERIAGSGSETYPTNFSARYRLAETTPVEGYGAAADIRGNFVDKFPIVPRPPAAVQEVVQRAVTRRRAAPTSQFSPEEVNALADQWTFARSTLQGNGPESLSQFVIRNGGINDRSREFRHIMGSAKERPGLINQRGGNPDDVALKAWQAGFLEGGERPTINQLLDALQSDLHGNTVVRAADRSRLDDIGVARRMAEELHELGVWRVRSADGLRTKLGHPPPAAEPAPPVMDPLQALERRELIRSALTPTGQPTATWQLLNKLGQEARGMGQLRGWRDGDFASPAFWDVMRRRLGDDIATILQGQSVGAVNRQANLQLPGLRDIRTSVRRAAEQAEAGGPQAAQGLDRAALERLEGAMTQDLRTFMHRAGDDGVEAAQRFADVDQAYGRDFIEGLRGPLRQLFRKNPDGTTISPDKAWRILQDATSQKNFDARLLNSYVRVLSEKGGPGATDRTTRMLLAPMTEGGLPGFLSAWGNLHPRARQILSEAGNAELFASLDKLHRIATRLAPYQQAIAERGVNPGARANIVLGAHVVTNLTGTGLMFGIPSAVFSLAGRYGLARFMASPRYLRWLTQVPNYSRGGAGSRALNEHIQRLQAIAGDDREFGQTVLQALGSVLQPASAQAQEGREPPLNREEQLTRFRQITGRAPRDEWELRSMFAPPDSQLRVLPGDRNISLPPADPGEASRIEEQPPPYFETDRLRRR